jgi:hypothetical protein
VTKFALRWEEGCHATPPTAAQPHQPTSRSLCEHARSLVRVLFMALMNARERAMAVLARSCDSHKASERDKKAAI